MDGCDTDLAKTTLHSCKKYRIENEATFWPKYRQDTDDPDMLSKYREDKEVFSSCIMYIRSEKCMFARIV